MSKIRSKRQLRAERREDARRLVRNSKFNEVRNCSNCGEVLKDHGHFVPPSCGEDGFFICQKKA